jgi:hypothetical protein
MINVISAEPSELALNLVFAALNRSVSSTQVQWVSPDAIHEIHESTSPILVAVNPSEEVGAQLLLWEKRGPGKLVLFGKLPENLIQHFGLKKTSWPVNAQSAGKSPYAPSYKFSESPARVHYVASIPGLKMTDWSRPFERFDFTDEWNNLGYGAIRMDDSIWAVSLPVKAAAKNEIGSIELENGELESAEIERGDGGTYCALFENSSVSTLWFNRAVGPIDSYEWRAVEYFLASFGAEKLPCQPVLHEIPWGHDAAITNSLDWFGSSRAV